MINFVLDKSKNYALVQQSLLKSICQHLDPKNWSSTLEQRREGCLNFSLFVRQPSDVLILSNTARAEFLDSLSHELRRPLNGHYVMRQKQSASEIVFTSEQPVALLIDEIGLRDYDQAGRHLEQVQDVQVFARLRAVRCTRRRRISQSMRRCISRKAGTAFVRIDSHG